MTAFAGQPQDTLSAVGWGGWGEWGSRDRSTPCGLSVRCGQRTRRGECQGKGLCSVPRAMGRCRRCGQGRAQPRETSPSCPGEGEGRAPMEKP